VGLPGTGLFYTVRPKKGRTSKTQSKPRQRSQPAAPLSPGFFARLMTPPEELKFVEGLKAFTAGDVDQTYRIFKQSWQFADAAFICGVMALDRQDFNLAEKALSTALNQHQQLGKYLRKYGLTFTLSLNVAEEIMVSLPFNRTGVLLALVEVWQRQEQFQQAADALMELRRLLPQDVAVKLSLAELLMTTEPDNREQAQYIVKMTANLDNECEIHTALLLYKARALRLLGMHTAARDELTKALRRTADRPPDLLQAIRYERALVYEELGQKTRARSEWERLYADDPDYEDVAKKLGQ
jgi:tetratricopeptide (TPR) repeat protein